MIYIIPLIIMLISLAVLFREEFETDTYDYLAMVSIGALLWPITIIWFISAWIVWKQE